MPTAVHVAHGGAVDYTPGTDVASGAVVVQGELVGVARTPIPANTLGSLAVAGIFDFPKATGVSTAITVGSNVYWDAANQRVTTTATGNKLVGKTVKAAVDADATARVRMMQ
jgi:predicted RecA/RadA family phage recombinase